MQIESTYVLSGVIDHMCFNRLLEFVENHIVDSCERLNIKISSGGGNVGVALAMAHFLRALPCKVHTYNLADVDSAAVVVFASGFRRVSPLHGMFTFHPPSKNLSGRMTSAELRAAADEIDSDLARIAGFLETRTSVSSEEWRMRMQASNRLSANEALCIGLVTDIEST